MAVDDSIRLSSAGAIHQWANSPALLTPTYQFPGFPGTSCVDAQFAGVSAGTSFAASVANVDLLVIQLGTNDQVVPLGQPGDAKNAHTFYGNMRWVVETYLAAKPTLRIVLVTTQYNGFFSPPTAAATYAAATEAYGNSVGVPVINMYKLGGINANTVQTLTDKSDTVHPSAFNFAKIYGPVIAQGLLQVF